MQTEIVYQDCTNLHFVFLVLGIFTSIIVWEILQKIFGLMISVGIRIFLWTHSQEDLQRKVAELQKISEEPPEIKHMMAQILDQQSNYADRLHADLESFYERLQADIEGRLEEECLRNDQRYGRLHTMVDGFKESSDRVREMLEKYGEFVDRLPVFPMTETWTQTERELLKKRREGLEKEDTVGERGQPRSIITVIRTALMEFLKEFQLQMSSQRNEAMLDLKNVFEQMCEDKNDLKNAIESSFSTATHQTQTSFLQFSNVGRDAMKCIAVLNEETEGTITTKFKECNANLKSIVEQLMALNLDVSNIKKTLDNVDGQFDEIYKKLELGSQKNAGHSEEVTRSLQTTTREWNEKFLQLDKQLNSVTHGIKDMMGKLGNTGRKGPGVTIDNLLNQNPTMFELEHDNIRVLLMTVQVCQEKMTSMKEQIDQNACGVRQSAELLLDELRFLTNMVKNSVETLKNLTIAMPDSENQPDESFKPEQAEFGGSILSLDTISEVTEEDQGDKEWKIPALKNSCMPELIEFIDANLDMARHTKYISDITKNS